MSLPCSPFSFMPGGDLSMIPWSAIARHGSAISLYFIAFVQWPGFMVAEWAGEDRSFAYSLTSLMFTLAFWNACLFHYLVSAGRVEINWRNGKVRGKGWIVRVSRRAHRVLLSLALAISSMTIVQSTTTAMVITHFYIKEDEPHAKEHAVLVLLKVDQTIAFFILGFVLGRLVFEPVAIRKHRRRETTVVSNDVEATIRDRLKLTELPDDGEECSICIERWSNRQLQCGHLLCCCCLAEIWKQAGGSVIRCPFCRADVSSVRRIRIADGGTVDVNDCCEGRAELASTTASSSDASSIQNDVEQRNSTITV